MRCLPFVVDRRVVAFVALGLLAGTQPASAHPTPFSFLDLHVRADRIDATLVVHVIDVAYELGIDDPARLLDPELADAERERMMAIIGERLTLRANEEVVPFEAGGVTVLAQRQAIRLAMQYPLNEPPGHLAVAARLFPYDPNHMTFLNIYERDQLVAQRIFDPSRLTHEHFPGTSDGRWAIIRRFVSTGVHHIIIGPDHILFLIGLLLLGGNLLSLMKIVTAFTLAHSVTLSLAVIGILRPSPAIVEPAIALSIVYIGADNLMVGRQGRDLRAWIALAFGLIHGFGFAGVLAEMDLPRQALGWTLVSFNVGVEVGQIMIVAVIATALAALRQRSTLAGRRIAVGGSVVVLLAGTYWFVERIFFTA